MFSNIILSHFAHMFNFSGKGDWMKCVSKDFSSIVEHSYSHGLFRVALFKSLYPKLCCCDVFFEASNMCCWKFCESSIFYDLEAVGN